MNSLLIEGREGFGIDKCVVLAEGPMSTVATSAVVVEGKFGKQVCFTMLSGATDYASAKGSIADLAVGEEVPVATATFQRVKNSETQHESYRVK